MRSRYSAFAVGDAAYLVRTWHPTTRPAAVTFDPDLRWSSLEIVGTTSGGLLDATGTVEFRAEYERLGERGTHREHSRFVREDGEWFYVDAEPPRRRPPPRRAPTPPRLT